MSLRFFRQTIARYPTETMLFSIAIIVRFCLMILFLRHFGSDFYTAGNSDSFGYLDIGKSIAEGHGFQMNGVTSAMRTPLYPLFLSVFYLLHIPLWVIPIVQHGIAGISAVLLYRIGKLFFGMRAGKIAGFLLAVEPYGVLLGNTVMTETLFLFFLLLSLYFFGQWMLLGKLRVSPALSGFFLGAATLVRPLTLYLPMVFLVFLFWRFRREWRQHIRRALVFGTVFAAVLAPWSVRQHRLFGSYELTNLDTYLLYFRVAPIAEAQARGIDYASAVRVLAENIHRMIPNFSEAALEHTFSYTSVLSQESRRILAQHPAAVVQYFFASIPSGLFASGYDEFLEIFGYERHAPDQHITGLFRDGRYGEALAALFGRDAFHAVFLIGALLWAAAYAGIILGFFVSWNTRPEGRLGMIFFLTLAAFFIFFSIGPLVFVRYRVLSYPELFLLIGCSFDLVLKKRV